MREHINQTIRQLPDSVFSFIIAFSRIEYAMKLHGMVNARARIKWIESDWDVLIVQLDISTQERHELTFFDHVSDIPSLAVIIREPPKRLCIVDGRLAGLDTPDVEDTYTLIGAMRTVRNNLFHGIKFTSVWGNIQRDTELVESSLVIIEEILNMMPNLKERFLWG